MAISIPSPLVEFILLGPMDDRRQLQDSPILGDVWVAFGKSPAARLDLLIAPYRGQHAGSVATEIIEQLGHDEDHEDLARIAFLQGLIVAELTFEEVAKVVAPKTKWWITRKSKVQEYNADQVQALLKKCLDSATEWDAKKSRRSLQEIPSLERFMALTGIVLWAGSYQIPKRELRRAQNDPIAYILEKVNKDLVKIAQLLAGLATEMLKNTPPGSEDTPPAPLVWQVSLNREAMPALTKSIPAVKADAAKYLFKVNCSEISWAVIDSGIAGDHPAFFDAEGNSRVKRSFDFREFRRIVSLGNLKPAIRANNAQKLMERKEILKNPPANDQEADEALKVLAEDAKRRGPIHWELVEKLVEIKPGTRPQSNHGTHVAGIIGASKEAARKAAEPAAGSEAGVRQDNPDFADGMCPDISLYDFRVLGAESKDTEFAIIAALQFIRFLNSRDYFFAIHGVNLSLSIPHDVRNFACGRTPICDECERLVASGVVVVAAAGNHGYKSFETKDGAYESYAAFSITDPGNADSVITVGATHRFWPHTYGVSFFSSRGPTGDGRMKPDLVAPGERIRAPLPGNEWGDLDGTSMAAPHVSGAAAMLMARYSELIGQPLHLKRILCQSATDLGRERTFQGNGMLDVLRAFQSI